MNNIGIFNQLDEEIKELDEVEKVLFFACDKENLTNVNFNVIIVDDETIKSLNKTYRQIDKVTDVITFALEDDDKVLNHSNVRVLGDIYISLYQAKRQADSYSHSLLRELSFLSIHGFYHLLGYDHMNKIDEKVMFDKQKEVLNSYGITR